VKKMRKILFVILALILVGIAVAQTLTYVSDKVQKEEDCKETEWEEQEQVYGTCTDLEIERVCEDEPYNTTCSDTLIPYEYNCLKETKTVEKTRTDCATTGFLVNELIKLHTQDYVCSTEEEDDKVIVICDSIRDSNRDGKCKPGESCMKFIIDGKNIEQFERNSGYEWTKEDKSFFTERASAEVLQ
jgi:hypothetical protein